MYIIHPTNAIEAITGKNQKNIAQSAKRGEMANSIRKTMKVSIT